VASLQQLSDDCVSYLNRRDVVDRVPTWVRMTETKIAQNLRARCMVVTVTQPIDNAYISLPPDFATMESIRDATSGELFVLLDEWSGHWTGAQTSAWQGAVGSILGQPCTAYRLVHDCIEWLPHPVIPDPPDPNWKPQMAMMGYYARPKPLLLPSDTNVILEQLYGVYLWGVIKEGALYELDDDRAQQADAKWREEVTAADLHKQQSDYSGAPYRSELATVF
jgi:hypothetical protein